MSSRSRTERWRGVVGFPTCFVSSEGKIRSGSEGKQRSVRERLLRPADDGNGYLYVLLRKDGRTFKRRVHNLVADAFVAKPMLPRLYVVHINGVRSDNRVQNLKWATRREVAEASKDRGTAAPSKLSERDRLEIAKLRKSGETLASLARRFNVSQALVSRVLSRAGAVRGKETVRKRSKPIEPVWPFIE